MNGKKLWEVILIGLFVIIIIVPICIIGIWAFVERWAWPDIIPQVFSLRAIESIQRRGSELALVFFSSIAISLVVAILSIIIGAMSARAISLYSFRGKNIMSFLTMMPFFVPATVFAMGIHSWFLRIGIGSSVTGVIIAHLIYSLPYAVYLLQEATAAIGLKYEEQARVLGATPMQAFTKTTLPNLTPALLSAFSMSYIVSFSQYFLTLLLGGGRVKTFTIIMVPFLSSGERNFAGVYSVIFLGITLIIFAGFEMITKRLIKNRDVGFYN